MIYSVQNDGVIGNSHTFEFTDSVYEYDVTLSMNTTFAFDVTEMSADAYKRLLRITMPSTVYSITFPNSVKWNRGFSPCMNVPSKVYLIELFTYDNGENWCGSWLCETEVA